MSKSGTLKKGQTLSESGEIFTDSSPVDSEDLWYWNPYVVMVVYSVPVILVFLIYLKNRDLSRTQSNVDVTSFVNGGQPAGYAEL